MSTPHPDLQSDDWRRIREALRYLGRDLHHRSYSVSADRRRLLWEEMDRCLELADRLDGVLHDPIHPLPLAWVDPESDVSSSAVDDEGAA